jgi:hypothetical protein
MEWIVAAALALAALIAAVGFWLGQRDPVTRNYKPGVGGLFRIGRSMRPPNHDKMRDNDSSGGGAGERRP